MHGLYLTRALEIILVPPLTCADYKQLSKRFKGIGFFFRGRNPGAKGSVGHYAQIVNAKTRRVGCAQATYRKGRWHMRTVICNYGEGVIIDMPLYHEGEPCKSDGPSDKDCDDGLLIE